MRYRQGTEINAAGGSDKASVNIRSMFSRTICSIPF
jgi:hypothetical protein